MEPVRAPAPGPPRAMEAVVGLLIPPACRDPVLGDLCERYRSPQQYLVDAARTVPLVILSQIRRTASPQLLLMEAFALYLSFLAAAWQLHALPLLYEQPGFLRLAIPTATALIVLLLADAYANPPDRPPWMPILEASLGVAAAFLSQAALSVANPQWLVPRSVLVFGAGVSLLLIAALRALNPPTVGHRLQGTSSSSGASLGVPSRDAPSPEGPALSAQEFRQKAQHFEKKIRCRNLGYSAALLMLAFLAWRMVIGQRVSERLAGGVIAAAGLYMAWQLSRRGPGAVAPGAPAAAYRDFYRAELVRQRDALRGIWSWYLGPFLGAVMAFALPVPLAHLDQPRLWWNITPFVALSLFWCFGMKRQTQRAADNLQREIDELDVPRR